MQQSKATAAEAEIALIIPHRWPGYIVAVAATAVAGLVSWAPPTHAGDMPLYLAYFPAVLAAAAVGGAWPGLLATTLSVLAANLLFMQLGGKLVFGANMQTERLFLFVGINVAISIVGGRFRRSTAALRESEARLRHFIDLAPVAIAMFDTRMHYLAVSKRWVENFRVSGQNLLGRLHYEIFPDLPERWKEVHRRCLSGAIESQEEDLFEHADGRRQWVRWEARPWHTPSGSIGGLVIFSEDITERKRLQEHLEELVEERTAKLHEALGDLEHMSYSMIHDMRAPLRAMQSFADMIEHKCRDRLPSPAPEYLDRIRDSANRLDRLITDALNYNRVVRENLPVTAIDLGRLLRSMVQTYPNLNPSVADIAIDVRDVMILGNESFLAQCFGNLLDNAVKFVAPGVRPVIRIRAESSSMDGIPAALICVQDNGIGIPKEAEEKIFGMFHRVHGESDYPGTGIGLSIVRKAVQRMGGKLGVQSEPGRGSTFWVQLPSATREQSEEELPRAA